MEATSNVTTEPTIEELVSLYRQIPRLREVVEMSMQKGDGAPHREALDGLTDLECVFSACAARLLLRQGEAPAPWHRRYHIGQAVNASCGDNYVSGTIVGIDRYSVLVQPDDDEVLPGTKQKRPAFVCPLTEPITAWAEPDELGIQTGD